MRTKNLARIAFHRLFYLSFGRTEGTELETDMPAALFSGAHFNSTFGEVQE